MKLRHLITLIVVVSACGSSGLEADDGQQAGENAQFAAENLELAEQSESDLVRRVVDDGVVSDVELEEVALATLECSEAAGVETLLEPSEGEEFGFDFTIVGAESPEELDELEQLFTGCYDRLYNTVSSVYIFQSPISSDLSARRSQFVTECLNDRGIVVEDWPVSGEDVDPAVEAECFDAAVAAHPQE